MTRVSALLGQRLASRVSSGSGGTPLITYYDPGAEERVELSAITFANWVAKTANLLSELSVGEGDLVRLDLLKRSPAHWVTLVWEAACWQVGAAVAAVQPEEQVAVTVVGPDWAGYETSMATEIVACSLHPLGLGFPAGVLPTGVTDYALEVRGQPDAYAGTVPSPHALAWMDAEQRLTQAELVELSAPAERRLVRPTDPWTACREGLIRPLVTGGSAVVVVGDDEDAIGHIAETEGTTKD